MADYKTDREWSDLAIPHIKQIVGPLLLEPAPFEFDAKQSTDLMIFNARDKRIAARVRRPGYAERYPFDFTLRSKRDNGVETELSKIMKGFGDWLFYGHMADDGSVCRWMVIDLNAFRYSLMLHGREFRLSYRRFDNNDGTHGVCLNARYFPSSPPLLIASSHEVECLSRQYALNLNEAAE